MYKLWVSDCGIETGDKKNLKCYTNHPFPFNLLFGFTLNFFPLSLLKLIYFKLGLSPVLFGTWLCSSTSCPARYSKPLCILHEIFSWIICFSLIYLIYKWFKCNNLSDKTVQCATNLPWYFGYCVKDKTMLAKSIQDASFFFSRIVEM